MQTMVTTVHNSAPWGPSPAMSYAAMFHRIDVQTLLVILYLSIGSIAASVLLCYLPDTPREDRPPPNRWRATCSIRALYAMVWLIWWPVAVPGVIAYQKLKKRRERRAAQLPRYESDPARDPAFRPPRPPRAGVPSALRPGASSRSVTFSARVNRVTWESVPLNDVVPRRAATPPPCYRETDPRRDNV